MLFRGTRLIGLFAGALGLVAACSGKTSDQPPDHASGGGSDSAGRAGSDAGTDTRGTADAGSESSGTAGADTRSTAGAAGEPPDEISLGGAAAGEAPTSGAGSTAGGAPSAGGALSAGGGSTAGASSLCGDGRVEGNESCDDGNTVPFDGCSASCGVEPKCASDGCSSTCGDGLRVGEACDDGNTQNGDGCSSKCEVEPGFVCLQSACEKLAGACVLRVPVIYRDFTDQHPDFEPTCAGQMAGTLATPKLVANTLLNGLPVATAAAKDACITALETWYSGKSTPPIVRELMLFDDGKGGYVNRYGALGEQWVSQPKFSNGRYCGNGDNGCLPTPAFAGCNFDPSVDTCLFPCPPSMGSATDSCAAVVSDPGTKYDGTPLFFPVDDQKKNETWLDADIPTQYGYNWEYEDQVVPTLGAPHVAGAKVHNFHFTTQLSYWFEYHATAGAQLKFEADDDAWVFVNSHLALDLGGVHQPVEGTLDLGPAAASAYQLSEGKVYELKIFHAERKKRSASLKITLPALDTSRSTCLPSH